MAQPKKTDTQEVEESQENGNDTTNKRIKFEPENWYTVESMAKATYTDVDTLINSAVLTLASMDVDEILDLMDKVHEARKERIRNNFS